MGWKENIKPLLGPILLPLIFFWRELLGFSVFAGFDFTHLILPFQQFARESLHNGTLPHWNPYLFAGFPQLAEGEGGLFYPGNLLLWLPGDQSVLLSWTVVLHLILTGCLMYVFLEGRGATRSTSAWIAVLYQFIPGLLLRFETVGLFEAVAWLPGLFWALECAVNEAVDGRKSRWLVWLLLASAIVAFMLLAGSSQIAFYGMIGAFFFLGGLVMMGPNQLARAGWSYLSFILIAVFSIILAAIQLLPTSEFAQLSYRVQEADFSYYRMGTWLNLPRLASLFMFPAVRLPADLLDYISSLGYIGLFPLILVGIALSNHRKYMNPILPAFILVFFGLILSFGLNFITNVDLITFPGFSLFRALGRMILPTVVGLFALAAVGLDALFRHIYEGGKRREIISGIRSIGVVVVIFEVWFIIFEGFPLLGFEVIGLSFLVVATIIVVIGLIGYFKTRGPGWLTGLLTAWLLLHLLALVPLKAAITMDRRSFNAAKEKLGLKGLIVSDELNRPTRVLIANQDDIWDPLLESLATAPFSSGDNLPIPALGNEITMSETGILNGYTPLVTDRWHEVMHDYAARGLNEVTQASGRLRVILALTGCDAIIAPANFVGGYDFKRVDANLDGVFPPDWHVMKTPRTVPYVSIPSYVEAWSDSDWEWFKHWIRQEDYIPGEWVCMEMDDDFPLPDGMEWGEILTPVEEEDPSLPIWGGMELDPDADAEILSVESHPGKITIGIRAENACWLVVRESFMPGWVAEIDGAPVEFARADYLFMGIPVPVGEHTVELCYKTPGLVTGALVSGVGWLIWVMLMVIVVVIGRKFI